MPVYIDPETGRPFDPSIPTKMALAANKRVVPFDTGKNITGVLGDLWDASKLAGLAPEFAPIGGAPNIPVATKMAGQAIGQGAKAGAREIAKQIEQGTGVFGKLTIDPRAYAYNPKDQYLGQNFERLFVGNHIKPQEINFDDWIGASVFSHPIDRTNRNYIVTDVSGIPINKEYQFLTEGGIGFGEDKNLLDKEIIMASTKNAMMNQYNRALKASQHNKEKLGGTGKIIVVPNIQSELGYNFSTMPTELIYALAKSQGLKPNQTAKIDDMVRNFSVAGKKPFTDWVGITDSKALDQLQRGEGLAGLPSDLRKVVLDKYTSVAGQKALNFNEKDLRLALTDKRLNNANKHDLGLLAYEMNLDRPPEPSVLGSGHKTYNYDAFGRNIGSMPLIPTEDFFGNVYSNIYNKIPSVSKTGKEIPSATKAQNTIHSLRDLHEDSALFVDEEQAKRLKRLAGQE